MFTFCLCRPPIFIVHSDWIKAKFTFLTHHHQLEHSNFKRIAIREPSPPCVNANFSLLERDDRHRQFRK